jgi:P27 family predicted phage terminase small subunit
MGLSRASGGGRKPKPSALREAEGNPGKRPLPKADLRPPTEPEKPAWLSPEAGAVWDGLVVHLMDLGVLQASDAAMLAELSDSIGLLHEARKVFNSLPEGQRLLVKEGAHGRTHASPLLRIIDQQKAIIHRIGSEFGLSPVARARLLLGDVAPRPSDFDLASVLSLDPPTWEN